MNRQDLYRVSVRTNRAAAAVIEEALAALDWNGAVWDDAERDDVRFEQFHSAEAQAREAADLLTQRLREWTPGQDWTVRVDCVPDEDWSETWKRFFHAIRVSDRIVVKPSWEPFDPAAASCVIELDPGMSFGTGQHATTQACLRMIDALCGEFPAASFLDIGCGSGILAIAAAKLGCREVTALDCDEIAVRTTRENLIRNGVATDVECRVADASNPALPRTFDIVTANILADVLVRHAAPIAATVSSRPAGGRLILAGILQSQGGAVRAAYERQGFRVLDAAHAGEWVTLLLGRQRTDTRNGYSTQTRTSCV